MDFWNDGDYVGGCIAGGRYLHINANGDMEPCAFIHYSDSTSTKTLLEALWPAPGVTSQPLTRTNHLFPAPCWTNNPGKPAMVDARSTDLMSLGAEAFSNVEAAANWAPVADAPGGEKASPRSVDEAGRKGILVGKGRVDPCSQRETDPLCPCNLDDVRRGVTRRRNV